MAQTTRPGNGDTTRPYLSLDTNAPSHTNLPHNTSTLSNPSNIYQFSNVHQLSNIDRPLNMSPPSNMSIQPNTQFPSNIQFQPNIPTTSSRTAPTARVNIQFGQSEPQQQYTPEQLQQLRQIQKRQGIYNKLGSMADVLRPKDNNYTYEPIRYQLPYIKLPIIQNTPGLHVMNPWLPKYDSILSAY
jgi:hypothetical protein